MDEHELLLLAVPFSRDVLRVTDLTDKEELDKLPEEDAGSAVAGQAGSGPQDTRSSSSQHTSSSKPCSIYWMFDMLMYLSSDQFQKMCYIVSEFAADRRMGLCQVADLAAALVMHLLCEPLEVPVSKAAEAGEVLEDRVYDIVALATLTMRIVRLLVTNSWPTSISAGQHPAAAALEKLQAAAAGVP
jgi:hypothetical protein